MPDPTSPPGGDGGLLKALMMRDITPKQAAQAVDLFRWEVMNDVVEHLRSGCYDHRPDIEEGWIECWCEPAGEISLLIPEEFRDES